MLILHELFKKVFMNLILKKALYSIFTASLLGLIFVSIEQIFRIYNDSLTFNLTVKLFFEYMAINLLIISLKSKKAIKIVYLIVILLIFFQYVHMNFYGSWIFPLEYILFFKDFSEVMQTFVSVLDITIIPFILSFIMYLLIYLMIDNLRDHRLKIPYMNYIWVLYLVFLPIHSYIKHSDKGAKPDMERNSLRNTVWTLSFLTGQILPKMIYGDSESEVAIVPIPNKIIENPKINIIVVMGESLTSEKMSLFGYKK